jgi:hypothetical protein
MNIVTIGPETYLEGLPNVGIVIHDQNVRLIHFAAYLVPGKREQEDPAQFFGILKANLITGKLQPLAVAGSAIISTFDPTYNEPRMDSLLPGCDVRWSAVCT